MFEKLKGLKNKFFGRQNNDSDAQIADVEEAQNEQIPEDAGNQVAENNQEVEDAARDVVEQDRIPQTPNALQELGAQLEASKTKAHTSMKGFFGKKNSDAYGNVLTAIRSCLSITSGSFSENPKENKSKMQSASFSSEMLITACKMYLAKNGNAKTDAGQNRLHKVAQILELAEKDLAGFHEMYSVLQTMPAQQQKGLTWNKILSDIRMETIEVEDLSKEKAMGKGAKTGDNASRGLKGIGVFTKEVKGGYDTHAVSTWEELTDRGGRNRKTVGAHEGTDDSYERNITNRNVATSRVANLLGLGGIVAHSKTVKVHDKATNTTFKGNLMDWAEGQGFDQLYGEHARAMAQKEEIGDDMEKREEAAKARMTPKLMGDLMNMQVLDYLCQQNDRHFENFFITQDKDGKMTGMTGIDNDNAFGHSTDYKEDALNERQDTSKQAQVVADGEMTMPYMDKTLADNVLNLKEEELEFALEDLIEPDTINAAKIRLRKLQEAIRNTMSKRPEAFVKEWSMDLHDDLMKGAMLHKRIQKHKGDGTDAVFKQDLNETFKPEMYCKDTKQGAKDRYEQLKDDNFYSYVMLFMMGANTVRGSSAHFYTTKELLKEQEKIDAEKAKKAQA